MNESSLTFDCMQIDTRNPLRYRAFEAGGRSMLTQLPRGRHVIVLYVKSVLNRMAHLRNIHLWQM